MTVRLPNVHRGEVEARIDGQSYILKLTLGALAEIEQVLAFDILEISERFENGRISAGDCLVILIAALRAGGHDVTDKEVAAMEFEDGLSGAFALVSKLFVSAFSTSNEI